MARVLQRSFDFSHPRTPEPMVGTFGE